MFLPQISSSSFVLGGGTRNVKNIVWKFWTFSKMLYLELFIAPSCTTRSVMLLEIYFKESVCSVIFTPPLMKWYLSLYLYLSISISLSLYLSIYLSLYIYTHAIHTSDLTVIVINVNNKVIETSMSILYKSINLFKSINVVVVFLCYVLSF